LSNHNGGRTPHVAILIETSSSYARGLLRGVRRYLAENGPWSVFMELRSLDTRPPLWIWNWHGDGILTRTANAQMAEAVQAVDVPMVELRSSRLNPSAPWVGVDNRAMGQMVAQHLLERGFRNFGVYALGTEVYFEQRIADFIDTVQSDGLPCSVYHRKGQPEKPKQWEKHQDELVDWVTNLPKPIGLMACTDQLGFFLLDACKRAGIAVPEEVAVVGAENDESLCKMTMPTLSSVRYNAQRIGYEAAAILDRMMAGEPPPEWPILIEPTGIVTRGASDVVAIEDPDIAQAVRFIREDACKGISVSDILQHVLISRSALERRMRAAIGRSPNEEIIRVRIERVKELLMSTDLPLTAIARHTGFQNSQYLVHVFKQKQGVTPGAFRDENVGPI
jgi:LacI family transcriptional regulator, galactose operon repressor